MDNQFTIGRPTANEKVINKKVIFELTFIYKKKGR